MKLNKDDVVEYLANMPYKLANGQEVSKEGEELQIRSEVSVQSQFFKVKKKKEVKPVESDSHKNKLKDIKDKSEEENKEEEKALEDMDKEELLQFADDNKLDVDKRKGEKKLRQEIKELLK